ncbi:MAG: hypothetical protein BYD32DRAFT_415297 [Podila humilis]|nr:MAG: hypothetical protein BYD32DRAFT_415297 [Podila humilis]
MCVRVCVCVCVWFLFMGCSREPHLPNHSSIRTRQERKNMGSLAESIGRRRRSGEKKKTNEKTIRQKRVQTGEERPSLHVLPWSSSSALLICLLGQGQCDQGIPKGDRPSPPLIVSYGNSESAGSAICLSIECAWGSERQDPVLFRTEEVGDIRAKQKGTTTVTIAPFLSF